jgi:hypothetical protein
MRVLTSIAMAAACVLLSTAIAMAQTLTTLSGKAIKVYSHTDTINPDCTTSSQTIMRVSQPPQHGTVQIVRSRVFGSFFAANNVRSVCNNRRLTGVVAYYNPRRGYVGTDWFSLEYFTSTGGTGSRNYTVNVR